MPNRILRDYTDSEPVNKLSYQAEVLFIRLMMKADDFGSFHANPKLIKSLLFPLRSDSIRDADISRWIAECEASGLIVVYTSDQKQYMRIVNFNQRLRNMRNKFPDPPSDNSPQLAATRREVPPDVEVETETESDVEVEAPPPIFHPGSIGDLETLANEALADRVYFVEHVYRQLRIPPDALPGHLKAFNEHLRSIGETQKTKKDYRGHFQNWFPKQKTVFKPKKMREI